LETSLSLKGKSCFRITFRYRLINQDKKMEQAKARGKPVKARARIEMAVKAAVKLEVKLVKVKAEAAAKDRTDKGPRARELILQELSQAAMALKQQLRKRGLDSEIS
jgi:ribonuclease HI